ncbi:MAG TPA: DUF2339 domain-containing protein [Chthoniobacter sp.]|nr:DUF2339 domain-containing protein [Chthoniobacter sp.]
MIALALIVFIVLIILVSGLYARLAEAESRIKETLERLRKIEADLRSSAAPASDAPKASTSTAAFNPAPAPPPKEPSVLPQAPKVSPIEHFVDTAHREDARAGTPPPLPSAAAPSPKTPEPMPPAKPLMEPPPAWASMRERVAEEQPKKEEKPLLPGLTLEAFMGVKLFAWVGGLALFLGIVFFVRYSFEHNLVTPQMRITIGALTGLGLIVGGLRMPRPQFAVTAQSLCATGVVSLYGVTYGAFAIYHFIGNIPAFAIMAGITAAAFLLAVRLNAQVVAVLGVLGGFLTPFLLSSGEDNPLGLFSYLAALNIGLIAVALRQRWHYLVTLGAVATAIMQFAWLGVYFTAEKVGTGTLVFLGFETLFLLPLWLCGREEKGTSWIAGAAIVSMGAVTIFAAHLLTLPAFGPTPWICFSILLAADLGLITVALRQRWQWLVPLAAFATMVIQFTWASSYFSASNIGPGALIFLGFEALFLLPFWLCHRNEESDPWTTAGSAISAGAALIFAGQLLSFPTLGARPWICLSILFAADVGLAVWPLRHRSRLAGSIFGGAAAFFILSAWSVRYLDNALLNWALGYILLFAAFHTVLPFVLKRMRPDQATPKWVQVFPVLGLAIMLWPALQIGASVPLWIAVLLADLAAIFLAALTASLLGLVGALIFTLIATGLWLAQTPTDHPQLGGLLTVILGFAALFCGASLFLQSRLRSQVQTGSRDPLEQDALEHLPAISAAVPFLLLITAVLRLSPENPSSIFGAGLLLVLIILGLARWSQTVALPPVALICTVLLQYSWHVQTQWQHGGWVPLGWSLAFTAVIYLFPFLFQSRTTALSAPWATAALAPVLHYPLIHGIVQHAWPDFWHSAGGIVPAALAIPPLAACDYLRRAIPAGNSARLSVLAWFGGIALLFITLIFPIQFHREWLTISWALEGAALLWLYHKIPHRGLHVIGFILLCVAFTRLTLNPAVLDYHPRSGFPILNWHLYTYASAAAAFFLAGRLTAPPRDRIGEIRLPATLFSLGTILLFLLLNIEIADYFSIGPTITFDFQGNLARDMTYSIAWSFFGLALLLVGMHRQVPGIRYAGIGLLALTLAKLFLHDLASLDQLYRIGALIVVAIVLIGSSYLYQRFLAVEDEKPPVK